MIFKFRNDEIIVFFASLSALYTCSLANKFWHSLLVSQSESLLFSTDQRLVIIYLSFYLSIISSALIILFENVRFLRVIAFVSSFGLALVLNENFGFRDWLIHPLIMFNLIFINTDSKHFKDFQTSILVSLSSVSIVILVHQFLSGKNPLKMLLFKFRELSYFEVIPGVGIKALMHIPWIFQLINFLIILMLITMPLSLKSKFQSNLFLVTSVIYFVFQSRFFGFNLLAWLLFILPLFLLAAHPPKTKEF